MDSEAEYILYCDESVREGQYYSNFYGGVLVGASLVQAVSSRLNAAKAALRFAGEVKWTKVTVAYLDKYCRLIDALFDEVEADRVKVRIMFRQNARKPRGLTKLQVEQTFYMLYYQFIKHGFGFAWMPAHDPTARLRVYFDQFPDTGEQVARFKGYILGLNASREFRNAALVINGEDLTEVRSHDHVLLQCIDIVLGAMAFRLNDMHLAKPKGSRRRAARTIAKEKLYKHILQRIRRVRAGFNIGVTTGAYPLEERWLQPYRHWAFVPSDHEYDASLTKPRQKEKPTGPT
jgi:Protein of unknown function (DUF3800)